MSDQMTMDEMLARRVRATDAGVLGAEIHQMPWATVARIVVDVLARGQPYVTTDDVWEILDGWGIGRPAEPRAMGAVMRRAVKGGTLDITDRIAQSQRAQTADGGTHHVGPVRVYISRLFPES